MYSVPGLLTMMQSRFRNGERNHEMGSKHKWIVSLCFIVSAATAATEDELNTLEIDAHMVQAEGLVSVAERAAGFAGVAVGPQNQPGSVAGINVDEKAADSLSKAIGAEMKRLATRCALMPPEEFSRTLNGLLKIITLLESQRQWRAALCACELRSACLKVTSARLVGLDEEPAERQLLQSQMSVEFSQMYQDLLSVTFPDYKQQVQSLKVPFSDRDWYAIFHLGRTGDKDAWPEHAPIAGWIFSHWRPQMCHTSNAPSMQELAFAVQFNEMERLIVTWLVRIRKDMPQLPDERNAFIAIAQKHVEFAADDVLPVSNAPIDAATLWKFYRGAKNNYEGWTEEASQKK